MTAKNIVDGVISSKELKEKWAKGGLVTGTGEGWHMSGTDDDFYETDVEYAFEDKVKEVVEGIARMLNEKNRKYGDAALNPSRIFSKADATEQIKVRIDDKLNRIKNAQDDEDEDVVKDLIGYLILLTIARGY